MKRLLTGECHEDNIYHLVDPTAFSEIEFEAEVVRALTCLFPRYWCGVFAGSFVLEGERRIADLAMIHKSLSHWFVIEVEIVGHSWEHHIKPQARCFRYGEAEQTCITSLERGFDFLDRETIKNLLSYIPYYVAVVGNLPNPVWEAELRGLDVQYLTVSIYRDRNGKSAHEVSGKLIARTESLGFAHFSGIHKCLRMNKDCGLPLGSIKIIDQFGVSALWTVRETEDALWISKDKGIPLLEHDRYVQIVRTFDGQISLRPS